jgi:hypothetical protein
MSSMPFEPKTQRIFAASVAGLAWIALLLQFYFSIQHSIAMGAGAMQGVWMYFAFFTILTNIIAATVLSVPIIAGASAFGRWCARPGTVSGVAANTVLVGIAYNLLLHHLWHPHGAQLVVDFVLHDAVPILFVVYAWLFVPDAGSFSGRLRWAAWPIVYFLYAMVRGAATGFYPYPFINVTSLGYARVLVNAVGLLAGYLLIAAVLAALERVRPRAPAAG